MSAGVSDQQRMKGQGNQVTNGPKEHVNEHEDFDSWRTQHHQGYTNPSMPSDPYSMSNYYGTSFPFQAFGVGDGTWSSNGDQMTFLGGYGAQMGPAEASYGMEGMFGAGGAGFGGAFGQPAQPTPAGFNYFHGNGGDYSTWGSSAGMQRKPQPHYEDYYRGGDASVQYSAVETLKDGMQGLGLSEGKGEVKGDQKEMGVGGGGGGQPKKMTWATIASQPAKPQPQMGPGGGMKKKGPGMPPPPMVPGKHNMDIGTWEGKNGGGGGGGGLSGIKAPVGPPPPPPPVKMAWSGPPGMRGNGGYTPGPAPPHHHTQVILAPPPQHYAPAALPVMPPPPQPAGPLPSHPVLDELRVKNNYNPVEFDMSAKDARFFVIKSYSEDDIHRSIKYEIWCSTEHGNKRLDQAYREREAKGGCVYLFFSVNGSGHFCGMARMVSTVDYHASASVWSQDKWKGQFRVRWVYVKDVPNTQLRQIKLENNENKPVTNSRDTQEVPLEKGRQVLRIMHVFRHSTSIFDDFVHYEKRQEEEDSRKDVPGPPSPPPPPQPLHSPGQHHKEREGGGGSRGGRGGGGRGSNRAN